MTTWSEWNRTTRFFKSASLALAREATIARSLPFASPSAVEFSSPFGNGRYNVSLAAHIGAVSDMALLCSLVLVFAYATTEEAARSHLTPTLGEREPIEQWGLRLLQRNGADWSAIRGGCSSLVEVAVARNAVVHGLPVEQRMINRIEGSGGVSPWRIGDRVVLSPAQVEEYRARLRGLLRNAAIR